MLRSTSLIGDFELTCPVYVNEKSLFTFSQALEIVKRYNNSNYLFHNDWCLPSTEAWNNIITTDFATTFFSANIDEDCPDGG